MKTMMLFILEIKVLIKTIMVMVSVVMIMTVMSLFQVYSSVLIFNSNCRLVFFFRYCYNVKPKSKTCV